jgi:hypothetical protein
MSGCSVCVTWAGSNVSKGVNVRVGEGVTVGGRTVSVGVDGAVSVIAGLNVGVGTVGAVAVGAHPAKAKASIPKREHKDNLFIIEISTIFPLAV